MSHHKAITKTKKKIVKIESRKELRGHTHKKKQIRCNLSK